MCSRLTDEQLAKRPQVPQAMQNSAATAKKAVLRGICTPMRRYFALWLNHFNGGMTEVCPN